MYLCYLESVKKSYRNNEVLGCLLGSFRLLFGTTNDRKHHGNVKENMIGKGWKKSYAGAPGSGPVGPLK